MTTKILSTSKNFYFTIYSHIKEHNSVSTLPSILNLKSRQSLYYYLRRLKTIKLIRKIGYGVWEVIAEFDEKKLETSKKITTGVHPHNQDTFKSKETRIRGHAFQFKVRLPSILNWKKRRVFLDKKNIKYKSLKLIGNTGERIFFKGRKIWLTDNAIIIYERTSFIADSALDSRNYAIDTMLKLLRSLELLFGVSYKINRKYIFTVDKQHYSRLKCELARQYRKDGKKLYVSDHRGFWFWADYSLTIDETETGNQEESHEDMDNHIHPFLNSLRNVKGYTPEFVTTSLAKIAEDRKYYAENLRSHVLAVNKLGVGVSKLGNIMDRIEGKIRLCDIQKKIHSLEDINMNASSISSLSQSDKDALSTWILKRFSISQ